MPLREIEFELPAEQYARMGYPGLQQGQTLTVLLDGGVLAPGPQGESWYAVRQEVWPSQFVQVGRARYGFSGQIKDADLFKQDEEQFAALVVDCDGVLLRVLCLPGEDGMLPFGVWETRYLAGCITLQGIVEDDFGLTVGHSSGITLWQFRRLVLTPGDPNFGRWHESVELLPTPYTFDRILVTARLHRQGI